MASEEAQTGSSGTGWGGSLTLRPGFVQYDGPGGSAAPHRHFALQLIRAREGTFRLTFDDRELEARAALVPSGVSHGFEATSMIELVLVEPEGPVGSVLQSVAVEMDGRDLDDRTSASDAKSLIEELIGGRETEPERDTPGSPAVERTLEFIEQNLDGRPTLEDAAANAHISPSRLTHLFTAEVGIPFSRYVLWTRLRRMIVLVGQGDNLTQAAHGAGFSDSAHLSRVFRENFGLPPSSLLQMKLTGDW